jgi:hypothetical protein
VPQIQRGDPPRMTSQTSKIWKLRLAVQRQILCRLLFEGLSTAECARKLRCRPQQIRELTHSPEFQTELSAYTKERLQCTDRKVDRTLEVALVALYRNLRHPDPWVRADAIEKVFKIHGRYIERVDLTGQLHHTGSVEHVFGRISEEQMTDEQRDLTRKLLVATRQPRALPPSMQSADDAEEQA